MHRNLSLVCLAFAMASLILPVRAHDGAHSGVAPERTGPSAYAFPLPEPGSYRLPPIRSAAGGTVLTARGARVDLARLVRGRITVFSFIYTRCTDICPVATTQLARLRELARETPELNRKLRLISMSFDPRHDTPDVMAEYGSLWRDPGDDGAEWLFLTTSGQAALRPILDAYDQAVAPDPDPAAQDSGLSHILRVFLIDEAGLVRNIYSMDFLDPELVLTDIRSLVSRSGAKN